MTTPNTLLDVHGLDIEVATRTGPQRVVDGVSFSLAAGEALGVVGESGCGKSLSMLSLLGLLPPAGRVAGGQALFRGRDLLAMDDRELRGVRGKEVGFVFQDPMASLNPILTIGEQLAEPLIHHGGLSRRDARERAGQLLEAVSIPGGRQRLNDYPHQLSGGMRQRVMIAISLACDPALVIADEPTTALDVTVQAQIVDLYRDVRRRTGMALIWITHDLALVSGLVDRIIVLYAGSVIEAAQVDTLYARPAHPYTRGLLASLPRLSGDPTHRLQSIGGAPPEPGRRPPGCPFQARCRFRVERCSQEAPRLEPLSPGGEHKVACWRAGETAWFDA